MHIKVDGIILTKLDFELIPENITESPQYGLSVSVHSEILNDGKMLVVAMTFDLAHGLEKPPFKFKFVYQGQFLWEDEGSPTIEEFQKIHAPAYIMPYARELVANITSRISALPTLVLPPINVHKLIEESEQRKSEAVADDPKPVEEPPT